jgi:hypothetical protein
MTTTTTVSPPRTFTPYNMMEPMATSTVTPQVMEPVATSTATPQATLSRKEKAAQKAQDDVKKAMARLEQLKRKAEEAAAAAKEPPKKRGRPAGRAAASSDCRKVRIQCKS